MSENLNEDVSALRRELERLNNHKFIQIHDKPIRLLAFNFARGMAFGLGTVVGASVLLSLAAWSLSQIDFIPVIGNWAAQIAAQIQVMADQ
ncbi:MAG: DUF5665 domain-containing protein [Aestuariivita sp.]|uniref:DUF5665 domain-containing protein n=1 Tax=Aestuariivita sp. TaxID=1872407 RepID=UPI003BB0A014